MRALTRISDSDEDEDNSPNFSLDGRSVESNVGCSLRWRDRVLRARGRKRNACMVRRMQTRGEDLAQPFAGRNTVDSAVDSRTASAAFCRQEYIHAVDSEVDSRTAMARDWLAAQRAACFPVLPLAATTRRSVCDSHYHFFCSFVS